MERNETLKRIECLLKQRGWSIYRLSKEADIPCSSLNNLFVRNNEPSISTLRKICHGLNISISDFFDDKDDNSLDICFTAEERSLIIEFKELTKHEKELTKAYIMGLKRKRITDTLEE